MENKIWKGRIAKNTDEAVDKFTSSINIDKELYLYDITGTAAHVMGLNKIGIITELELKKIIGGLKKVKKNIEIGQVDTAVYEDIHSLIENELGKIIGDTAMKIHTGRSRNDQVVLDEKLFIKDIIIDLLNKIITLQKNIIKIAVKSTDIIMPAYTHMQKAQPVLLSHYLLAYFEMLKRDRERYIDCLKRVNIMPLGAGAF